MSDPELPWKLLPKEDGVWLHFGRDVPVCDLEGDPMTAILGDDVLINLGPKEQVMEAFSQFLESEDFGERMDG